MRAAVLIILMIVAIRHISHAQQMQVLKWGKVELQGNIYDFYESEVLFENSPMANQKYQRAKKAKKSGRTWELISLGSLGAGILLLATTGHKGSCDYICISTGQGIGIISTFINFPITGIVAIIANVNAKTRLKKAAKIYNYENQLIGSMRESPIKLSLGLSQNGLGLVLIF